MTVHSIRKLHACKDIYGTHNGDYQVLSNDCPKRKCSLL